MPTSALPRGRQTKLRLAWETTFGVNPGSAFFELNTYTSDLARARTLDADDILGAGFANNVDARPAGPDVETATGKLTVPLDLVQIGFWLAAAMGRIAPTGSGPYTHAFTSGVTPLPSFSLERELVAASQYDGFNGAVIKTLKLPFKPGKGYNMIDLDLVGKQVLEPYTSTAAGTPTVEALANRVPNSVGIVKIAGSQVGNVIDGSFTLTNDITLDRYIGSSTYPAAAILEGMDVAVDLTARYATDVLANYGALGGAILPPVQEVDFIYTLGAMVLTVSLPNVRFEPVNKPVSNGKTITIAMKGRAEVGASAAMMTATLVNTQSTEY